MIKKNAHTRVNFYELVIIFLLGSAAGVIIEGIWSLISYGAWQYHTALVIGPFNIIYGFGAAAMALAAAFCGRSIALDFLIFAISAGVIEYLGSLFEEIAFGARSWDYSAQLGNIGGRVSPASIIAWGVLGCAFVRLVLPPVLRILRKIPRTRVKFIAIFALIFLSFNAALTSLALTRWQQRRSGEAADSALDAMLDECFPNERMRRIFPSMSFIPKK